MTNFKARTFICAVGGETQSMTAPLKFRFAAGVVPSWVPCSPLFAILIRRKVYLAVPGAPNSALPCSIKQKQSTRCESPRSSDLIRELIPGSLKVWKCIQVAGKKKKKSHHVGSSSPYSADRDLQFSRDDGLALTIPNNILISLTHTDQNCVRSSKNAHLHTAQCGTAPAEPPWGSHTSKHPAEPKSS